MRREGHAGRGSGIARWLLSALLLHGVVAMMAMALSRWAGPSVTPPVTPPVPDPSSAGPRATSDLIFLDDESPSGATDDVIAGSASFGATRPTMLERSEIARGRRARVEASRGAAHGEASQSASAPSETASSGAAPLPGEDSPSSGGVSVNPPLHPGPATLSLDQLGIGATNPFIGLPRESLSPEERANRRLQASLRQGSLDSARQRGLGPEGPVVNAARRLVLADEALVETSAVLNVRVDAGGRVTSVDVLEAASQPEAWRVISDRLLNTLGPVTLRLAQPGQALSLKLRLASAMRLPSGAAPGLRTDLLGQTLHRGGGPGSTSISLSPTAPLRRDEVFDSSGRHQDHPLQFELGLLELKGDVADIASPARRVVQVAVLSVDALAKP